MNRKLSKILAALLVLAMAFSMASCSSFENFFDLDHGNERTHSQRRDRDRNKKDKDDDEDEEDDDSDVDDSYDDEDDEETPDTNPDFPGFNSDLTYPDHVPTNDELHPYHAPGTIAGQEASDLLDEIEHEFFVRNFDSSYVDAVILYDDYEAMGITIDEISWGTGYSDEDEELNYYTETLERLYTIDYESLDAQDRAFYDKVVYDYEINEYLSSYTAFQYYTIEFDPLLGPQCNLFFILDVIEFKTVEDAENYILLVADIDRYYDEILNFEEDRAEFGFASPASVYESIAESFDALCAQEDDCFLYESFATRLDAISGITPEQKANLISRHEDTMHNVLFPEFEECSQRMGALASYDGEQHGLCDFPGGAAYYQIVFMVYSNSSKTIDESIAQVDAMIDSLYTTMTNIAYSGDMSWYAEYSNHNYSMGDTTDNLNYLSNAVQFDFPELPAHSYVLRDVPAALEDNFSPAAYLGYHLDRFDSNLIITNQSQVTDTFGVTCAHEGYPGHMFQSVYTRSVCEHPYVYLTASIGYEEGWATYVENYSFKYFTNSETAGILIQIENEFNTLIFARVDMGINYEGWTVEDCNSWYRSVFGQSGADFTEMYEIVTNQPGYGVKYGIGFVNTGLVITQAHHDFPDATEQEIHTAYLNALPLTFEMIYERMQVELSGN